MCVSTAEGKAGRGWWDMDDIKKENNYNGGSLPWCIFIFLAQPRFKQGYERG